MITGVNWRLSQLGWSTIERLNGRSPLNDGHCSHCLRGVQEPTSYFPTARTHVWPLLLWSAIMKSVMVIVKPTWESIRLSNQWDFLRYIRRRYFFLQPLICKQSNWYIISCVMFGQRITSLSRDKQGRGVPQKWSNKYIFAFYCNLIIINHLPKMIKLFKKLIAYSKSVLSRKDSKSTI